MKDLTLSTMIAVFEEMFGPALFWALVALAVVVTALYVFVLVRDHRVRWRKFLWAQLSMPFGAVAAVAFAGWITNSGPSDAGGPVDWIVMLGVAAMGAVGLAIAVYTAQSLIWPPTSRTRSGDAA